MLNKQFFLISGLIFMLLAVALGAFGAHALKAMLSEHYIQIWKTATDYLVYHALGLIGLGIWQDKKESPRFVTVSGIFFIVGILLFCGSLYSLAITGITKLGMITPVGGIFFMLGWLFWILSVVKTGKN